MWETWVRSLGWEARKIVFKDKYIQHTHTYPWNNIMKEPIYKDSNRGTNQNIFLVDIFSVKCLLGFFVVTVVFLLISFLTFPNFTESMNLLIVLCLTDSYMGKKWVFKFPKPAIVFLIHVCEKFQMTFQTLHKLPSCVGVLKSVKKHVYLRHWETCYCIKGNHLLTVILIGAQEIIF